VLVVGVLVSPAEAADLAVLDLDSVAKRWEYDNARKLPDAVWQVIHQITDAGNGRGSCAG